MIDGCRVKIENNSNIGDIIVNVYHYNLLDCVIQKELSELSQEQKEMVLNFIRNYLKKEVTERSENGIWQKYLKKLQQKKQG